MRYLACLLIAAAFCVRPASAHPSGVSKVDITLKPDSVEARVEFKPDDILNVVHRDLFAIPLSARGEISDQIAHYLETRLELKFDGRAGLPRVLQYKKKGDPAAKLDSADYMDTTLALRLGWAIPPGAQKLEIGSKMFVELEIQPLCHVRVFYQGQEIRRKFLGVDDRVTVPLAKDSLEALYAAATQPPPAPGQAPSAQVQAGSGEESVVGRFLWLGFTHILPEGTDHILFVLGLFFFSTYFRPLLVQITAFTIAHSITLGLSLFGVFSLPSRVVEPLIALSIAVVAVENIFFRKMRPSRFLIVFAFGLIHGLGFAGVLKSLGLPEGQFLKVLVSFNLGVEGGQLAVVSMAAAATFWMWKKPWYFKRVVVPVSALIAAVGLFWFVQRIVWPV
jgi:hypothetical protein